MRWGGDAVNRFFTDHGEPAEFRVPTAGRGSPRFRVFAGPIGSGDAVIADRESDIAGISPRTTTRSL